VETHDSTIDRIFEPYEIGDAVDHTIKGAFLTLHNHFTATRVKVLHLGCNIFYPESTWLSGPTPQSEECQL
jgi:hypothetical protein